MTQPKTTTRTRAAAKPKPAPKADTPTPETDTAAAEADTTTPEPETTTAPTTDATQAADSAPIVSPAPEVDEDGRVKFRLGKKPAVEGAVRFNFTDVVTMSALPKIPKVLGHEGLLPTNIGMLGNDSVGDCVFAGAAHETMLWNLEARRQVNFTDHSVLSDYSAVTGYNPADPNTDQGTDMSAAASYRRKTGVLDGNGGRHKVAAYLALKKGNLNELAAAAYLFGAVGIGIEFPDTAMDQFNNNEPWDVVPGAKIEGGHYVPLVGRTGDGNWVVLTWGRAQAVTPAFLKKYNDESIAYVSTEALTKGLSLEGFNVAKLQQLLTTVAHTS